MACRTRRVSNGCASSWKRNFKRRDGNNAAAAADSGGARNELQTEGGGLMPTYASGTNVSTDQTRSEIERILKRYGATMFAYASAEEPPRAMIEFVAEQRRVRFLLPLPTRNDPEVTHIKSRGYKRKRNESSAQRFWEQQIRQRWRALRLSVLSKLEAVESKITTFEDEFLAHIVDPSTNKTVGEVIKSQIAVGYAGKPQALRLGFEPINETTEE